MNCAFTLALCPGPTLKDSVTNSTIKLSDVITATISWGHCSLCHRILFMRTQWRNFSLDSVPRIIMLLLSNKWASFLRALGNTFLLTFSSLLQNSSQTCGPREANLGTRMTLLNSSHVSFFRFSSNSPLFVYFFFYLNLSKYMKAAIIFFWN